ncbi:MAG TPA: hypothetical protein VM325_15185 [Alphaproteobacteria bacterium]|nr:hypothetical protein [Alphaproteobacteria bacterium]
MAHDKTQKPEAEAPNVDTPVTVFGDRYDAKVECPWCGSTDSRVVNPFGGTVSEIAFTCQSCGNPFGWMKW